jgi:hypothetical protein
MALQTKERVHGRAVGWRGFESRRGYWDFSFTYSRLPYYGHGAIQPLTGMATRGTAGADNLTIWEPQPPGVPRLDVVLFMLSSDVVVHLISVQQS